MGCKLGMVLIVNVLCGISSLFLLGVMNFVLGQGSVSCDDLICDMGCGLIVILMLGLLINVMIGDYLCGVSGFWVENGQIIYVVNECIIVGNLCDMLMWIIVVNDVCDWYVMCVFSLFVEGMIVVGV